MSITDEVRSVYALCMEYKDKKKLHGGDLTISDFLGRRSPTRNLLKSGFVEFYPRRSDLTADWWRTFYTARKKPDSITIMGQSLSKVFNDKKQSSFFYEWCTAGTDMRVLLLSPEAPEISQIQSVGKGISYGGILDPNLILRKKIEDTVALFHVNVASKINDRARKPMLRFSTKDMPFSLVAIDDDMVITLYGISPEADEQPTFVIKGEKSSAHERFMHEFNRIWQLYSRVFPYDDPILKDYRRDWQKYIQLTNYESSTPPPRQAIIFPTYRCSQNCSYCMYKAIRHTSSENNFEMDCGSFDSLLDELISCGIMRLEIAGGGEPLEHANISEIVEIISKKIKQYPELKIGLLTNGAGISKLQLDKLIIAFNDYVRISRFEGICLTPDNSEGYKEWRNNIAALMRIKRNNLDIQTNIGIKYLLTTTNANSFVDIVEQDLTDADLRGADHFRFRSARSVESETIVRVEKELSYLLEKVGLRADNPRISLSLSHVVYPNNFRCWISPMNLVIAPNGDINLCCNYAYDSSSKCIGNIFSNRLDIIWRSKQHRQKRSEIRKANCDRAEYCNCRYAELQNQLERIIPYIYNF